MEAASRFNKGSSTEVYNDFTMDSKTMVAKPGGPATDTISSME